MIDKDYFNQTEKTDYELLLEFNEKTRCFQTTERTADKSETDASAATGSRIFSIELKKRNQVIIPSGGTYVISGCSDAGNPYFCDDLYIEGHKAASLFFSRIEGYTPIYINFMEDGTTVIYNLDMLRHKVECTKTQNIRSRGYNKFELAKRFKLHLDDAIIYSKEGKVIKTQKL